MNYSKAATAVRQAKAQSRGARPGLPARETLDDAMARLRIGRERAAQPGADAAAISTMARALAATAFSMSAKGMTLELPADDRRKRVWDALFEELTGVFFESGRDMGICAVSCQTTDCPRYFVEKVEEGEIVVHASAALRPGSIVLEMFPYATRKRPSLPDPDFKPPSLL